METITFDRINIAVDSFYSAYSRVAIYLSLLQKSANALSLPVYATDLLIKKKLCIKSKSLIANSLKDKSIESYICDLDSLIQDTTLFLNELKKLKELYHEQQN